jgi:hypothetical protein
MCLDFPLAEPLAVVRYTARMIYISFQAQSARKLLCVATLVAAAETARRGHVDADVGLVVLVMVGFVFGARALLHVWQRDAIEGASDFPNPHGAPQSRTPY